MGLEKFTVREVAQRFNLSEAHVRKLVTNKELVPLSSDASRTVFSSQEVQRFSEKLRALRLESLKEIARASELIGLYDDDYEPLENSTSANEKPST